MADAHTPVCFRHRHGVDKEHIPGHMGRAFHMTALDLQNPCHRAVQLRHKEAAPFRRLRKVRLRQQILIGAVNIRSPLHVHLLHLLGVKVRLCAPRTLLPAGVENWPVEVFSDLGRAVRDVDAVMCLRLQLERQQAGLLPDLAEYSRRFCLGAAHLELARPEAKVLHPGPMNRGLEISNEIADAPASLVLDQVAAGVATRMAVLYLLATRNDGGNA